MVLELLGGPAHAGLAPGPATSFVESSTVGTAPTLPPTATYPVTPDQAAAQWSAHAYQQSVEAVAARAAAVRSALLAGEHASAAQDAATQAQIAVTTAAQAAAAKAEGGFLVP